MLNIVSNDYSRIVARFSNILELLHLPFTSAALLYFIVQVAGSAGLICAGIVVLIIIIEILIGKSNFSFMENANNIRDSRIKHITEMIEGIRVIKNYAWELAFQ